MISRKGVFIGGGLDDNNFEIYQSFIDYATFSSNLYLGIITGASSPDESEYNGRFYVNLFQQIYKITNVEWLPIDLNHPLNAYDPSTVEKVSKLTGIFFGGGDQARLIIFYFQI